MKSYSSKLSLVTGASSGIGKAIAADLASRGSNLILTARSKDRLEALAAELHADRRLKVEVITLDLAADGAPQRLFEEVGRRGLSVDLLVNNAGFGKWGSFLDDDRPTYAEMMSLNMRAVVGLCHLFLPSMTAKGDCGILNVGSTASFIPVPWSAVYGATKAFVLSFSEALAYEYRDRGVQVTILCPGNTQSNFSKVANAKAVKGENESQFPRMGREDRARRADQGENHGHPRPRQPAGRHAAALPAPRTGAQDRRRDLEEAAALARGRV